MEINIIREIIFQSNRQKEYINNKFNIIYKSTNNFKNCKKSFKNDILIIIYNRYNVFSFIICKNFFIIL